MCKVVCFRCLLDNDNEVRDRAILYLEVLKKRQKSLATQYILSGEESACGTTYVLYILCVFRIGCVHCWFRACSASLHQGANSDTI